jgi:cell division protein FtsZ
VVDPNANIIFGAVIDDRLQGEVRITVIATGFTGDIQPPSAQTTVTPRVVTPIPTTTTTTRRPTPLQQPVNNPTPSVEPPKEKPSLDIPDFLQRRRTPPRN